MDENKETLEDKMQAAFGGTFSGTGEEELLRVASKFSLQYSGAQIRILTYLEDLALRYKGRNKIMHDRIKGFISMYCDLKQYNNSDMFVMTALEAISLKKFMGENALRVNVEK